MEATWKITTSRHTLLLGEDEIPPNLVTIFSASDHFTNRPLIENYSRSEKHLGSRQKVQIMAGYRATIKEIRNRLDLMGYTHEGVWNDACASISNLLKDDHVKNLWPSVIGPPEEVLKQLIEWVRNSYENWTLPENQSLEEQFLSYIWEDLVETPLDPRFLIRLLSYDLRGNMTVTLDLTDLCCAGHLAWEDDLVEEASFRMQHETLTSGKIIVIPEGPSDSAIIKKCLEIGRPDVAHQFSFLNFESNGAPGGTDRVVSLTRGLAGAGVMNRVLALLDNDSAGRDAQRILMDSSLPPHFGVMRLPDVEFAYSYPTLGPSGAAKEDVNGRAVSVEFMLGPESMMKANDGKLPPVRWRSYLSSIGDYQGSLEIKGPVQRAIMDDLKHQEIFLSKQGERLESWRTGWWN